MSHRKIYYTLPEACTGCRICEIVCSLFHEKVGVDPLGSRIKIRIFPERGVMIPKVCRLCRKPLCVAACPVEALSQNAETGLIELDEEKCDGCGLCEEACTFDGILIHPLKKIPMVCDLCGGEPLCVKYCMNRTLVFIKPEEYRNVKAGAEKDKTEPGWPTPAALGTADNSEE